MITRKFKDIFLKRFTSQYTKLFIGIFLIFAVGFSFYVLGQTKEPNGSYKNNTGTDQNQKIEYPDFRLIIEKIDVNVPIVKNVDGYNKTEYIKSLKKGVAHFKNTALPNQKNNCYIFGHSSYYAGKYKEIFKDLPKLKKGDEFSVWYQTKEYRYKITESKEVPKNALWVMDQTSEQKVSLTTCYPIGTNDARWMVTGVLK